VVTWESRTAVSISVAIHAPPEWVWQVISDVERWPEWTASVTHVKLQTPGPLALGSRARVKQPKFPAAVWRVTALTPGQSFTWRRIVAGVHGRRRAYRGGAPGWGAGDVGANLQRPVRGPMGARDAGHH